MKRKIGFVTADVFTTSAFGGNPVAVIPDAGGLNGDVMQKIAGEFNLSETTFVLPPKDPAHTAEVRVFTPRAEIPFAGHPNIGTAFVLATLGKCHGRPVSDRLVFEELAGLVEVELAKDCEGVVGAILRAPQTFQRGETVTAESVASACSLDPGDIEVGNHEPCIASTGMPFVFAELKSRGALASANPRPDVFAEHFATDMTSGIQLYVPSETERVDLET